MRATRITSTAPIPGTSLRGFYVSSTNAGTLVLRHGSASGAQISGTITPAIGWHNFPCLVEGGLHATVAGTALDVTFIMD